MSLRESIEKAWDPDSFESIHDLEAMIKAPLEEKSSGLPLGGETPPSWKESTAPWIIFEIGDVDLAVIRRKKKTGGKMKKKYKKKTCKKKTNANTNPAFLFLRFLVSEFFTNSNAISSSAGGLRSAQSTGSTASPPEAALERNFGDDFFQLVAFYNS